MRSLFKRSRILAALLLSAIIAAGYLLIPVNETGPSKANFDRIQNGWSEREVAELLGGYASSDGFESGLIGGPTHVSTTMMWTDDESNEIRVQFNQGVVTDKILTASDLSLWERLKRRVSRRVRGLWPGS